MFKRKKAIDSQKRIIALCAQELVPIVGDKVEWVTPLLGRFTLMNFMIEGSSLPFYDLRAASRIDLLTDRFPYETFVFNGRGEIIGTITANVQVNPTPEAVQEYSEEVDFQIKNKLTSPNSEDYDKLVKYLTNGKMDVVNVKA